MSTRLRGNAPRRSGPYPLGEIPTEVIVAIGRQIVHRLAVGVADITGDDFGTIFAAAVNGTHRGRPLGVADVGLDDCAWSLKTIKNPKPFTLKIARLISGRNSPVFAHGITEPFADIQKTGDSVLRVWNARIDEALAEYDDLRIVSLIRNIERLEFIIMEFEANRFIPQDYTWKLNKKQNFVGHDASGQHMFTWQPHGAQFTILHKIPPSARRFRITRRPPMVPLEDVLRSVGFDESWIEAV